MTEFDWFDEIGEESKTNRKGEVDGWSRGKEGEEREFLDFVCRSNPVNRRALSQALSWNSVKTFYCSSSQSNRFGLVFISHEGWFCFSRELSRDPVSLPR